MLYWAMVFLIVAIIAGVLGFVGVATAAAGFAKILFYIFLIVFLVTLIIGYTLGTSLLQLGYQRGSALTVAGLATLFTNALPILAGTIVLREPVPTGGLRLVQRDVGVAEQVAG